jgi:hypothetical protein
MNVEWSKDGYPLAVYGSNAVVQTTGFDSIKKPAILKEENDDELMLDNFKIASWFDATNDYPNKTIQTYLRKSPALRSAIDYKVRLSIGNGLMPAEIVGINEDGTEELKPILDIKIHKFLSSRMIRRYQYEAYQNLWESGMAFPQLISNKEGTYFSVIKNHDSPFCRFTKKEKGVIKHCLVSGKWPDVTSKDDYEALSVLDLEGSEDEIIARAQQLKSFIYPISLNTSGNIYYQLPPWDTARAGGHLDISIKIAEYLMYMFDNQMSIKYHITIPYSYWDKKYPLEDYKSTKELEIRKSKIAKDLDDIENNLTTTKNAKKAIMTHFELNQQGKAEEKWGIEVIDDKYKTEQYLPQAAASNAEIFTSLNINPAVKGLSLSSGPYSNSSGGSDIREAFLIDNALAWVDRQEIIDPIELMVRINFKKENLVLRSRSLVLTTLDTGSGTQKTLS